MTEKLLNHQAPRFDLYDSNPGQFAKVEEARSELKLDRVSQAIHSADLQLKEKNQIEQPNILDLIDTNTFFGKFQHFFHNAPPWFQFLQDHFTMGLNYVGIVFNTLAVVATNTKFFNKPLAEWLDKKSEWYSRYIIPFSFAWNGLEALAGNRAVEALVRLVPALSFWALPFYNFNTATGVSSGVNYMLELVGKRFEKEGRAMPIESMGANLKHVGKVLIDIFKDFISNTKTNTEDWMDKLTSLLLLGGSLGGFAFAAKDRDTWLARLFGNMRNLGGFIGDYTLVTNPKFNVHKKVVGFSCGMASILNTIMRWVDPTLARTLNHISIAADDFGLTYWAQDSRRENKSKQKATTVTA